MNKTSLINQEYASSHALVTNFYTRGIKSASMVTQDSEPSCSTQQRLMDRINRFMMTRAGNHKVFSLFQQFTGNATASSEPVRLDPEGSMQHFSQWLMLDIPFPGEKIRLLELFAISELFKLPQEEQALLKRWLTDRPSFYLVVKNTRAGNGVYFIQDLLTHDDMIRVKDMDTASILDRGSLFMGRAVLADVNQLYGMLGTVTELSWKAWMDLSKLISAWSDIYFEDHYSATRQDFFRAYYPEFCRILHTIPKSESGIR